MSLSPASEAVNLELLMLYQLQSSTANYRRASEQERGPQPQWTVPQTGSGTTHRREIHCLHQTEYRDRDFRSYSWVCSFANQPVPSQQATTSTYMTCDMIHTDSTCMYVVVGTSSFGMSLSLSVHARTMVVPWYSCTMYSLAGMI